MSEGVERPMRRRWAATDGNELMPGRGIQVPWPHRFRPCLQEDGLNTYATLLKNELNISHYRRFILPYVSSCNLENRMGTFVELSHFCGNIRRNLRKVRWLGLHKRLARDAMTRAKRALLSSPKYRGGSWRVGFCAQQRGVYGKRTRCSREPIRRAQ